MQLKLLFFGVLTDVTGSNHIGLMTDAPDIGSLISFLHSEYPGLEKQAYKIAVNDEFVTHGKKLEDGDEVAFLPPFAGG